MTWIAKWLYRRYPHFADAVNQRYAMYNRQVENVIKLAEKGDIFVIRPSVDLKIKRIEKIRINCRQCMNWYERYAITVGKFIGLFK